jgi:hypothetical protein
VFWKRIWKAGKHPADGLYTRVHFVRRFETQHRPGGIDASLFGLDLYPAFTWCLCSFEGVDFVFLIPEM